MFRSLSLFAFVAASAQAHEEHMFLGRRDGHISMAAAKKAMDVDLLEKLEEFVGREHREIAETRVTTLEDSLRPMFVAMPKNEASTLDAPAVRYVLHRLFVQRHGWFVRGIDSEGEAWNSSSPVDILKEHAGDDVHGLFEQHLGNHGFTLRQVAVFAATLESFVHIETLDRLKGAHRIMNAKEHEELQPDKAESVINAYMLMYVMEMDHATVTREEVDEAFAQIETVYPTWPATAEFVAQIRQSVLSSNLGESVTHWEGMVKVLDEVGMQYGKWQNHECSALKKTMLDIEEPGTGRVPLASFYGSALNDGNWQFMESVPYLRQLGALDDSNPGQMSVIIPNYINSPSNCVAASKFYRVCCIDECDSLLGHLEEQVGAPDASPAVLAKLVAALPSETVITPRALPTSLLSRLDEIAAHHNGRVLLHSRLFAQWMHHAYPRECRFPHVSGTTRPQEASSWMQQTGQEAEADQDDMRRLMTEASSRDVDMYEQDSQLPWSAEEELVVAMTAAQSHTPRHESLWKSFMIFMAPCSMTLIILRQMAVPAAAAVLGTPQAKYAV